ncbi:MAG TPA: DUF2249 domain-containing protein [Streptosporangiaceae bacterium]|nr:DUF2249 domain-containing protein [Streptosporangiaceae bacterium]
MAVTEAEAYAAMLAHHKALDEGLRERADAVLAAVSSARPYEVAVADVITYLAEEVLPHAAAEEKTIYPAAVKHADLSEMTAEHVFLSAASSQLAAVTSGSAAAEQARTIADHFSAHAAKENDVLLPALLADESVDLASLLGELHHFAEQAGTPAPAAGSADGDLPAELVSLLLQGAAALARAGGADRACRIAASAWAALRGPRPDLAVKLTAALHGLTRKVDGPVASKAPDGVDVTVDPNLDVRDMPPAQRHVTIFETYDALQPGTAFVLVNDHDPKPLGYQFEAEHAGDFTWDYLENGPEVWRVRIGRPAAAEHAAADAAEINADAAGEEPDLDVRKVSHGQRHGLIFTAYRSLRPGRGFVLVNDHDPKPLKYQFDASHAGEFTWDYLEAGPKVWRVRIGRTAG